MANQGVGETASVKERIDGASRRRAGAFQAWRAFFRLFRITSAHDRQNG
jgi:hypothetical protein